MLLHAWRLSFSHPVTGETMRLEAPLDAAYQALLERFGWMHALPDTTPGMRNAFPST
jgi:tRNA pseudouridine65 synthase